MERGSFYILRFNAEDGTCTVSKVSGHINKTLAIGIHFSRDMFDYGWRVTDLKSGTAIERGTTKKDAYDQYKKSADKQTEEKEKPRYKGLCEVYNKLIKEQGDQV